MHCPQVLYRPIGEGFGFKMLQKMGWKDRVVLFWAFAQVNLHERDIRSRHVSLWFQSNWRNTVVKCGLHVLGGFLIQGIFHICSPPRQLRPRGPKHPLVGFSSSKEGEGLGKEEKGLATPWLGFFRSFNQGSFEAMWKMCEQKVVASGEFLKDKQCFCSTSTWFDSKKTDQRDYLPESTQPAPRLWVDPREGRSWWLKNAQNLMAFFSQNEVSVIFFFWCFFLRSVNEFFKSCFFRVLCQRLILADHFLNIHLHWTW